MENTELEYLGDYYSPIKQYNTKQRIVNPKIIKKKIYGIRLLKINNNINKLIRKKI